MKIVTVSREFGSGGRELGKRLADQLGFAYYDREIITAIAEKSQFHEDYVENVLNQGAFTHFPITYGHTFTYPSPLQQNATKILVAQEEIIRELGAKGKDCVIVGRSADVILAEYDPLNLFVYAEKEAKMRRCRQRAPEGEQLTDRELERRIKQVDNSRARYRQLLTSKRWGRKESYHLMINTTDLSIKEMTPWIAEFARHWFERDGK